LKVNQHDIETGVRIEPCDEIEKTKELFAAVVFSATIKQCITWHVMAGKRDFAIESPL
jgi:hypothetical protein